jgi:hypothetical protein
VGGFLFAGTLGVAMLGWSQGSPTSVPVVLPEPPPPRFERALDVRVFQKGNLHTHSIVSDGDVPPNEVYAWYRDHGYNFVALTDHNTRVEPKVYKHLERPGFVILPGEELTMVGADKPVHMNAICSSRKIGGGRFPTAKEAIAHGLKEIEAQGAVSILNHPNFDWALTRDDVASAATVDLLEIASGHPYVYAAGDAERPSAEAMWDHALSLGVRQAPAGVDDTHHFQNKVMNSKAARPGRAYVAVFAAAADERLLCDKLRAGELYASSGADIERIVVNEDEFTVYPEDPHAKVQFIGKGGEVLAEVSPGPFTGASYRLRGRELYVRARIENADQKRAWTPAFYVETDDQFAR